MSMIKCSECGKDVSDKASTCPSCGTPLSAKAAPKPKKRIKKIIVTVIVILVIIISIYTAIIEFAAREMVERAKNIAGSAHYTYETL